MKKQTFIRTAASLLLIAAIATGLASCSSTPASQSSSTAETNEQNTSPINIVWYPNESSNTHDDIRAEVGRLVEQATGRKAVNLTTTDYTIAIQSIASGSADIAFAMGAVGYIEAKNRNPQVDVLFVNSDKNGSLDEAKYFSWICVPKANADEYKAGSDYSIDNIKGKKMSFVSNSSTSGFRVPTSSIIAHFASDALTEDDLLPDGSFFSEVYFGQSHQGSAINLLTGNADIAAYCDIELQSYIQLKEGTENTVGAVYEIINGADAPFDQHAGEEFVVIACTPVFNGPNAYNPQNLSADEIKAIQDLFTSAEVASNELLFYDADVEGAFGLYKKSSSYGYVLTTDSWYDAYR
ncbi:MAG: phosphate/phosphite/phosphonate ABC transporter substrate-binding protein [Eubacteriaceae bacterium]|nr:phosphate/phosphite/phosphonate ABC transporter substrate-binding protein [Eubacteriaceae bacterium]